MENGKNKLFDSNLYNHLVNRNFRRKLQKKLNYEKLNYRKMR